MPVVRVKMISSRTVAALAVLAALLVTVTACAVAGQPAAPPEPATAAAAGQSGRPALVVVHDPGQVTGTITGRCHYRDGGQLPDPRCTPGAVDPAVTQADIQQTICVTGYTVTVRPAESETERFKYDVAYPAYGTPRSERTELDHLVPLELGGSNAASNLWPEYPPSPNPKDDVELTLRRAVCSGRVTLAAAQRAIAANWMTAEQQLGLGQGAAAP